MSKEIDYGSGVWGRASFPSRKDIIGVRDLPDGRQEYLMHNEALCNPYYLAVSAAPSTPAPPHPEYGSSNLLDAPLPDKCEEHPWAPFISNGTKGWICFSCWDHKLLEEAESTLAGECESRKQAEDALRWMSRNRALTIFIEEPEHVANFFEKCDAALKSVPLGICNRQEGQRVCGLDVAHEGDHTDGEETWSPIPREPAERERGK